MKALLTLIALVFSITFPVSALAISESFALAPAPGGIENTGETEYEIFPEEPGRGDISSSETAESERFIALLNETNNVPVVDPFLAGISAAVTLGTGSNAIAALSVILVVSMAYFLLRKPYRNP